MNTFATQTVLSRFKGMIQETAYLGTQYYIPAWQFTKVNKVYTKECSALTSLSYNCTPIQHCLP